MNNSLSPKDRTTAIGLFNFARSYWRSSEQLRASKPDVSHPEAPIVFLFYHAIELYLKAYVRSAGYNLQQLKDISHNITKAGRAAQKDGLQLSNDDFELLAVIDSHDNVVRTRYKTTGAYTYPTAPKALTGTLSSSESARNPNNPRPSALKLVTGAHARLLLELSRGPRSGCTSTCSNSNGANYISDEVRAFVESEWPEAHAQAAAEETAGLMMMRLERVGAFTLACGTGS